MDPFIVFSKHMHSAQTSAKRLQHPTTILPRNFSQTNEVGYVSLQNFWRALPTSRRMVAYREAIITPTFLLKPNKNHAYQVKDK